MSTQEFVNLKKPSVPGIALAVTALGALAAVRYYGTHKFNSAERLAEALLDGDGLHAAARSLPDASETVLAACASFLIKVSYRAAIGQGLIGGMEDPIGHSRNHHHPYTQAIATVLTEAHSPEHLLTYAMVIPDIGEVKGTRRVGAFRVKGLTRPANDIAQITLPHGFTGQMESEFEIIENPLTGQTRLFGAATLRDNHGNVARLNIGFDGVANGTITRDARIVGRFEGKINTEQGITFRQYQIEPGD